MKFMKSFVFASILAQSSLALAGTTGGISGGGGGTTNPSPVSRERVAEAVEKGPGPILAYLKGAQSRYDWALSTKSGELGDEHGEREKALFIKLFSGPKTILDIYAKAKIEIRSTEPCYDAEGKPWDGSVYASTPGAVCISSFTMAPKLSERNVASETMALIIHELSHQLGANEDEAQAIQNDAINAFSKVDLENYRFNMIGVAMWANGPFKEVAQKAIASPAQFVGKEIQELSRVMYAFLQLQDFGSGGTLRVTSSPTFNRIATYKILMATIQDAACLLDKGGRPEERKACAEKQRKVFRNDSSLTAKKYLSRETGLPESAFGGEYDLVLHKITNYPQLKAELVRYLEFLEQIDREVQAHAVTQYKVIQK